ncbi:hypothetical protein HA402_001832 [Bradysia odoriphaga]|nr:hypothetical protein HA402_001832 [Bradysia odoriphaga]
MDFKSISFVLCFVVVLGYCAQVIDGDDKLRVCIVEGRGTYKKATKFCPTLEQTSKMECVIGIDRLDCLRRIHKGSAHFGVFSSEDLVTARWANVEILITNEMRFHDSPFEYEIVAIVDNEADINSVHDLRGSKFCHPGHGLQSHWTEVLANYFESTLVSRLCEEELSLVESRIRASAEYFGPSCKAGPWVPDPTEDRLLKRKYPSLCELCYNPQTCAKGDKHWGRRGPLYCLTGGYGEVAWVRLDDAKSHFGFSGTAAESSPSEYSYLCPDGHLQPMHTEKPCIWVAKPWPVVAAQPKHAAEIQSMLTNINHDNQNSWQNALLSLLESYHVNVTTLDRSIPIDDYLDQAIGFQSAYSFATCSPPRSIIYCTTSLIQHYKCSWLQEASSVYGIEPNIQCIRTESMQRCMDDTKHKVADVVLVDQDERLNAEREYHLKPLLYEFSSEFYERYVVLAVIKDGSRINDFSDLKGKRACFPNFEGAAYLSVLETLWNYSLVEKSCPHHVNLANYFSTDSCIWDDKHTCNDRYFGEMGALRCLADGVGDVAFISSGTFKSFKDGSANSTWQKNLKTESLKLLCPYGRAAKPKDEYCFLNWTPRGHLMISNETESVRRNEIYNSFRDMDRLFGKQYKSHTTPFTMFGPFDRKNNVMFRDNTDGLRGLEELQKDKSFRLLDKTFTIYAEDVCTSDAIQIAYRLSYLSWTAVLLAFVYLK